MKRITEPRYIALATALTLSKGSTLDALEVEVTGSNSPYRGTSEHGEYSVQTLYITQDGKQAEMACWNRADLSHLKGRRIAVESTLNGKDKATGLTVDEDKKGNRRLKVAEWALIDDLSQTNVAPEQQSHNQKQEKAAEPAPSANRGAQSRSDEPQQRGAPRGTQQAPASQSATQAQGARKHGPVFGATVGMAINQASAILLARANSPEYYDSTDYSRDLHTIASDIIRVAHMLEEGRLALPAKGREEKEAPSHRRPGQAQAPLPTGYESHQDPYAESSAPREDVDQPPASWKDNLESDDVPF